jgi:Asp-tRNA(Asn)/Glu-tRNA(Gln) amidotransferase A subunit family amidase
VLVRHAAEIAPVYVHITLAEAAAVHAATLESRAGDYTASVRLRLEMGRYVLAEDYVRARRGQAVLTREVQTALQSADVLLVPTIAMPAVTLGAQTITLDGVEEPVRNVAMRLTQLFNLSGHPAITLPCGATAAGLPIGLQLAASETRQLLRLASAIEPLFAGHAS